MQTHKRVLIVGTVPYNEDVNVKSVRSYFRFWEKENLAQIFSNAKAPVKGHCAPFFRLRTRECSNGAQQKNGNGRCV